MLKTLVVLAALLMPMVASAQGVPPHEAWVVTVPLKAEGHLSPVFYSLQAFRTKNECDVFRGSAEWKEFFHEWAVEEIEAHDGEVDFGSGAYCGQVKDIKPYVEERGA